MNDSTPFELFQKRFKQIEEAKEAAFTMLKCQSFNNDFQFQLLAKDILNDYKNNAKNEIALLPNYGDTRDMLAVINYAVSIIQDAVRKKEQEGSDNDPFLEDEQFCNTWLNKIVSICNNINNWTSLNESSLDSVSSIMEGLKDQLSGPQSKLVASVSSVLYDRGKEYRERKRNVNRRVEQLKTEAKQQAWTEVEKKLKEISIKDTKSDQYLINLLVAQIECCGNSEFRSSFIENVINTFDIKGNPDQMYQLFVWYINHADYYRNLDHHIGWKICDKAYYLWQEMPKWIKDKALLSDSTLLLKRLGYFDEEDLDESQRMKSSKLKSVMGSINKLMN